MRKAVVGITLFLLAAPVLADKELDDRMMHAASILQEIRGPLDENAPGVLQDTYAVAVFPEFVKVGLLGGVKHGRGVLAARMASGNWSKPAFVRITSGSLGLQFGVSMSQLLIVFKDPKAVEAISGGQFTIGADAGYAAGELGGSATAGTDNKLENRIVAMARSKGLFAGAALEGGVLRIEKDSNVEFYDNAIGLDGRTLLEDEEVELPPVAQHFLIVLDESVPPLSPEASPVSWGRKASDELDLKVDGSAAKAAHSDTRDAAGEDTESALNGESAGDGSMASTQLPPQAIASAPGTPAHDSAAQGAWITPGGAELPSVNIAPETTSAATWVSPEEAASVQGEASQEQERSGGTGLGGRIVGKVTEAAWDGAKELALESIRNNPETQGAKLAAKVGEELVDGAGAGSRPRSPPEQPSRPPVATVANNGQWVEPLNAQADLAGPPSQAGKPDYRLASRTPDSLPAIASVRNTDLPGPPAPSEWPDDWRDAQILGGVCEPGS